MLGAQSDPVRFSRMDAPALRYALFYFCYFAALGAHAPYIGRYVDALGHSGYVVGAMLAISRTVNTSGKLVAFEYLRVVERERDALEAEARRERHAVSPGDSSGVFATSGSSITNVVPASGAEPTSMRPPCRSMMP